MKQSSSSLLYKIVPTRSLLWLCICIPHMSLCGSWRFTLLSYVGGEIERQLVKVDLTHPIHAYMKESRRPDHNTRDSVGSLTSHSVIFMNKGCGMGPPAYSPYPRRLESLTICWCNCKGSTFYSVILRPWLMVRSESNSNLPRDSPMLNQLSHGAQSSMKLLLRSGFGPLYLCSV